jgi:succinoglycan biosynthesis transport protein ExoP
MTPQELASERGTTLSQKHEELGILQAMQTGGFEVVQEAGAPRSPVSPTPVRNAGFAFIGGLVFAILAAFLLDYVDRRIKSEEAMEKAFGLPVLSSVPTLGRQWLSRNPNRLDRMIGFRNADSPFFEAFRTLRSNLKFYQGDKRTQTLLITSGLPEEGKTVTAVNLALSLALSGVRVVLIEADLRRPMLHEYLKLSTRVGVSSVLANTVTFEEALQVVKLADFASPDSDYTTSELAKSTMQSGLLCLTSGPLPPNPGELLGSQRMKDLIAWAVSLAECVIIDTPPVLLVSDAINIATHSDGVIIATKIKGTTYGQARDVRTILDRTGCRALGVVANGAPHKQGDYYRGQYKGYYALNK